MTTPAFVPAYDPKNVLTGLARTFLAPVGTLGPDDTVALGGDWGVDWIPVGASQQGLKFRGSRNTNDIPIEEQAPPVDIKTQSQDVRAEIVLAEDTLAVWKYAFGGGTITSTAAAAGTPGVDDLVLSSELEHLAAGFEGVNPKGFWRRVILPEVANVGEVETDYRRAESQRLYACSFRLLTAVEDISIRDMTAVAL